MQILQLHDLMQDNCLLSFFPFFFGGGGGGGSDIYFANTFIIYSALLRDHASPKFSGDVTSPSRRFRAMF